MTQYIKRITQFACNILTGTSSATFTVSPACDVTKTILIPNGSLSSNGSETGFGASQIALALTNSTTVTGFLHTATFDTVEEIFGTLVEFSAGVTNIQYGVDTIAAGGTLGAGATITAVGSLAFLIPIGVISHSGGDVYAAATNVAISYTSSTVVKASTGFAVDADTDVYFISVELDSAVVKSAQLASVTSSSNAASNASTAFTAVTMANTVIFPSGNEYGNITDDTDVSFWNAALTSTTQVTWTRDTANTVTRKLRAYVVEFQSGILLSAVQRGTITLNTSPQFDTISSVNTHYSFANYCGVSTNASESDIARVTTLITSATQLESVAVTGGFGQEITYEVASFPNFMEASITETATATDSASGPVSFAATLTEAATATVAQSTTAAFAGSVTEAASATDAVNAIANMSVSHTETATAADSQSSAADFLVGVAESATATTTQDGMGGFVASVTEVADATDYSETGSAVLEVATAADTQTVTANLLASVTETATAADAPSAGTSTPASISEVASATDTQNFTYGQSAVVVESASASDVATGGLVYAASVVEGAAANDTSDGVTFRALSGYTQTAAGLPIPFCAIELRRTSDNAIISEGMSDGTGFCTILLPVTGDTYTILAYDPASPEMRGALFNVAAAA